MSRVLSNARRSRLAQWTARAPIVAAVLAPLLLVAWPATELARERERMQQVARTTRAARPELGPKTDREDVVRRTEELAGRLAPVRPLQLDVLEARTLLALFARESGLAVGEVRPVASEGAEGELRLEVAGSGRLSEWVLWIDALAKAGVYARVERARFDRDGAAGSERFRARLEVVLHARSAARRSS